MKKIINTFIWTVAVLIAIMFCRCDDMDDLYQKYVDEGEITYLGATDSLETFAGQGRIKLKWYYNADPNIETTVIYWNNRQDSIVKNFVRTERGIQADSIIIDNLPEGTYDFELVNRNSAGERSIFSTTQGVSYGDTYIASLKNRTISALKLLAYDKETQTCSIEITWGPRLVGFIGTKVSYKKRSTGEQAVVYASDDATTTIITDVGARLNHPDDLLQIATRYFESNTIDTLVTTPRKEQTCVYTVSGTRYEYSSSGELTSTTPYTDLIKILNRVAVLNATDAYDCNRVADSPSGIANTLFRLVLKGEDITMEGYYNGLLNTLSNADASKYTADQQKLTLKYKILKSNGAYSIVEETFLPPNISFPVVPQKVYSFGANKDGIFFSRENDLLRVDATGDMWLYRPGADNTFGAPTLITSGWTGFSSIFYLPDNRIFRYDQSRVDVMTIDDNYNVLGLAEYVGSGWTSLNIDRLMPFKDFALIMTNTDGALRRIGINAANGWTTGFVTIIASGFKNYWKIVPYDNLVLGIDQVGDLYMASLSDDFVLGSAMKLGGGWNKYIDVIKCGTALLCIDANGDLWRYDFNPDLSWNID